MQPVTLLKVNSYLDIFSTLLPNLVTSSISKTTACANHKSIFQLKHKADKRKCRRKVSR